MQEKLILEMKRLHITSKELACIIGISEKQFGNKLNGKVDFKSSEMFIIADYLHKKIDDIFLPTMYDNRTKNVRGD